jgi:outer membrane receptor protein involved in Fe transport
MYRKSFARFLAPLFMLSSALPLAAQEAAPAPADDRGGVEEIIVTAQKREQSIDDVGMSIQAATGDQLAELGVTDTTQLDRVVTGFNANVTYYGTAIYTIRGVGFQDTSLAGSPTVSIYIDEMPLQFSAMTSGATLDLQRVEALKGPQGTLFGQNATGGAVNYIANKPTQEFEAGFDVSYGRFNTADISGFVSGPITETVSARVAGRVLRGGPWQKSHTRNASLAPDPFWTANGRTYGRDAEHGDSEFYNARGSLLWEPSDALSVLFTASGFVDKGDSQMPQLYGISPLNNTSPLIGLVANYPVSPRNNRAADWGPCVNTSGTGSGVVIDPDPVFDFPGVGDSNTANRLYDNCKAAERDNTFYSTTLRVDYALTDDLTITSLTSWSKFDRDAALESDGTLYQDYESWQTGYLKALFQEVRVSGSVGGEGNWVVGANYENTSTWDSFLQTYGISSAVPTIVPVPPLTLIPPFNWAGLNATPLGPTNPNNRQTADTFAVFANLEYPVLDSVIVQGGVRYTNQKRDYRGCGSDGGDGTWADISQNIQTLLRYLDDFTTIIPGVDAGPGKCASFGPASQNYAPEPEGFTDELDEDNVSWRVGVNWNATDTMLLYANVSQGYKSGSFPTVASAAFYQLVPAKQEDLLAYEVGGKFGLFDDTVQLNAAAFYYDYTDKQILGAVADPVFGSLPALVNVPESHVVGFELSAILQPIEGLRFSPSVSYARSEVDGTFRGFDPFFRAYDAFNLTPAQNQVLRNASTKDFSGLPFPNAPKWTVNFDSQYEWQVGDWLAFVGANLNYQSATKGFFHDRCNEDPSTVDPVTGFLVSCTSTFRSNDSQAFGDSDLVINARALLDLRAGVEHGAWRVWLYGRNVTNKHYWNQAQHVNDVLLRFTGMPATYGITVSYRYGN